MSNTRRVRWVMASAAAAYTAGCFAPAYKEVDSLYGTGGETWTIKPTGGHGMTGGEPATGGAETGGVMVDTGGSLSTGGSLATGGSGAKTFTTGGTTATGGTKTAASGGVFTTGGTRTVATGGIAASGGTKTLSTGGSRATGGSSAAVCADVDYPLLCPAIGLTASSCWTPDASCSTVTTCEQDGLRHACATSDRYYDCSIGECTQCTSSSPVACPALAGFSAGCWPSGTVCATLANCRGAGRSCANTNDYYDCTAESCKHCSDPKYPVACPALGSAAANCWEAGTVCSTVAHCSDGDHACADPARYFDCSTAKCVACTDPAMPVGCATINGVGAGCWTPGTICSTIALCGTSGKACSSPVRKIDCSTNKCVLTY